MEYGYLFVTPNGSNKAIHIKVLKDLIRDEELITLISDCHFDEKDLEKIIKITNNEKIYSQIRKEHVVIIFVRGKNAISKLKQIASKYNEMPESEKTDKNARYADNVYVSNTEQEAIEDLCEYTGIEDFTKLDNMFNNNSFNKIINGFNFHGSEDVKKR